MCVVAVVVSVAVVAVVVSVAVVFQTFEDVLRFNTCSHTPPSYHTVLRVRDATAVRKNVSSHRIPGHVTSQHPAGAVGQARAALWSGQGLAAIG